MKKLVLGFACLLLAIPCQANPIPWPPPASMPLEDMYVEIQPSGDGLHAVFTGDFTFTYIPEDVNSMLFPVPPDANNIGVWQDDVELAWAWSSQLYPTILEEIPNIPMIEWQGPFPEDGAVFTVDYEHDLIKRPAEFIFFYALGTGKYFPTYEKTTTAYFDILLPIGFTVAGVWLDETAHEYEVVDGHLMVTVESWFGPITNDLIVSLVPATANWWWPPSDVEIVPEHPTSSDVVAITLSGNWPDSCIPYDSTVSMTGNDIYFEVFEDTSGSCWAVITPWERMESVGPLSPGRYTVYAALVNPMEAVIPEYTLVTEFTVAETNTYVFVPDQSTVVQTGGFAGIYQTHFIEGQFQLTVDFDANTASFDQVDANLSESVYLPTQSLGDLFDMTELVGTVVSDTEIDFDTANPLPGGKVVHLDVTLAGNSVHLTGGYCDTYPDGFCFDMDAIAQKLAVYYVDAVDGNDLNDGLTPETAFATIQKGIDSAADGYTVIVQPGLYEENINFLGKNITLKSTDPTNEDIINSTIIDGTDVDSVVIFSGTESSSCVLSGFTITNGMAPEGGGIYGNGTMATIENNTICGNAGTGGGKPGDYGAGGGLLDCDGLIQNNIITGNSAGFGGGLNRCDGVIRNNIISDNGWYAGGGLFACHGTISNNLLVANGAVYGGGLVSCNGAISNCTVVGNWSAHDGSGLDECNGSISNCIIYQNWPPWIEQIESCSTPAYSCIEDWDGAGIGNISADPCFVLPRYWDTNGVWVDGDYHLKSQGWRWDTQRKVWTWDDVTSRCIDDGNPGSSVGEELLTIPVDPNNEWGQNLRINMGAYGGTAEASMPPYDWSILSDLTNDGIVNFEDYAGQAIDWLESESEQPGDLNRDGTVDIADIALLTEDWLKQTSWYVP